MNIRSLFVVLFIFFGAQTSSAQSSSEYGKLLWSGKYTCTGSGFQGMDPHVFMAPFVFEMKIYEKVLIYEDSEKFYFQGMKEAYYIRGRLYKNDTNNVSFLISDYGVPFIYMEGTQNLPYVGNVKTTSIVFVNVGDGSDSVAGGGFNGGVNYGNGGTNGGNNGGNYNNQQQTKRLRKCTVCYGRGVCSVCNGSKWVTNSFGNKGLHKCGACGGTGLCKSCNGTGEKAYW